MCQRDQHKINLCKLNKAWRFVFRIVDRLTQLRRVRHTEAVVRQLRKPCVTSRCRECPLATAFANRQTHRV